VVITLEVTEICTIICVDKHSRFQHLMQYFSNGNHDFSRFYNSVSIRSFGFVKF
jgi:hypothetical protein